VDKEFYFKKWVLNFYVDIQNLYNFKTESAPSYTNLDTEGNIIPDANGDPTKQGLRVFSNLGGTILPTLGLIVKL
jgi:hypothetical protein